MLQIAIETAEMFRELKELNLLPSLDDITAYEFECFKSAERAARKVQNDKMEEMNKNQDGKKKNPNSLNQGDKTALNW